MIKIPYKLRGCGNDIFEIVEEQNSPSTNPIFNSCFYSEGRKSILEATPVSKKELYKRIERIEQELEFLKSFNLV